MCHWVTSHYSGPTRGGGGGGGGCNSSPLWYSCVDIQTRETSVIRTTKCSWFERLLLPTLQPGINTNNSRNVVKKILFRMRGINQESHVGGRGVAGVWGLAPS